jgi:DNA polymerase III delta prime subunit
MSGSLPPVDEFAAAFVEFMREMHEAAERPESPLVARIREHLGVEPDELPVTSATFGLADRPNLQLALDAMLPDRETIGLGRPHMGPMDGGFTQLFARFGPGPRSGGVPVEYADVELGDGTVVRCIVSALLLASFDGAPVALTVGGGEPHGPMGQAQIKLEGIAGTEGSVSELLRALRAAMVEHSVFRGKVFALTQLGSVVFPSVPRVERGAVVLPEGTLERLEHHSIALAEHAQKLRAAGRHLKRGVLLHGPPGTGKTLTVNYLLTATEGRTTVLLTGQALGQIGQAFAIARDLAPATIVLEDVDLVAAERTMPGGHGVLFELLNQLEGLSEDSDLLVLLTTNRPDLVEPALAARPGRVDLALELPLPDENGRRRLLRLYAQQIELDTETEQVLVERTNGGTGAMIKELMRQADLRAAVNGTTATAEDVLSILDEMLDERAALTRRLLGQPPGGDGPPTPPPPGMLRALTASGMPPPPDLRFGP